MSELLDGTGHPRNHGYAQCSRCGCQRPKGALIGLGPDACEGYACSDVAFCSRAAGVGLGKLDVEVKP